MFLSIQRLFEKRTIKPVLTFVRTCACEADGVLEKCYVLETQTRPSLLQANKVVGSCQRKVNSTIIRQKEVNKV